MNTDELIEALPYARGDERRELLFSIGRLGGGAAPPFLRQILHERALTTIERCAAMRALADLDGPACGPMLVAMLDFPRRDVQSAAAHLLAERCTEDRWHALFEYFKRVIRTRPRTAERTTDVPAAANAAANWGRIEDLRRFLDEHVSKLNGDEAYWLCHRYPQISSRYAELALDATDISTGGSVAPWSVFHVERPELSLPFDEARAQTVLRRISLRRAKLGQSAEV